MEMMKDFFFPLYMTIMISNNHIHLALPLRWNLKIIGNHLAFNLKRTEHDKAQCSPLRNNKSTLDWYRLFGTNLITFNDKTTLKKVSRDVQPSLQQGLQWWAVLNL